MSDGIPLQVAAFQDIPTGSLELILQMHSVLNLDSACMLWVMMLELITDGLLDRGKSLFLRCGASKSRRTTITQA